MRAVCAAVGLGLAFVASFATYAAAQSSLTLQQVGAGQIAVDGDVGEWHGARWHELGDDEDASIEWTLGYDAEALYVAARVWDDELVRTQRHGRSEDAVVLTVAVPTAGRAKRTSEVWLFAGIMGRQAAAGSVAAPGAAPRRNDALAVVEGPLEGGKGYVLEARVPLSAIESGRDWTLAGGALRLVDVDRKGGRREVASAKPGSGGAWPPLLAEGGPNAALAAFLRSKGAFKTRFDLVGDVTGDSRLDRVAIAGTFGVVVGPDIGDGSGFHFVDLPVTTSVGIKSAQLRDLTGDGKAELLVRLRQSNDLGSRELLHVVRLSEPPPAPIFAVELSKETSEGKVDATIDIGRGRKGEPPAIEVGIGSADGLGPDDLREARVSGIEPILLPWGPIARRVYQWDGSRFAVIEEDENEEAAQSAVPAARTQVSRIERGPPRVESHPEPPGVDELVAAFRASVGIDEGLRPRFERHVNVAEDRRYESLMLFGRHLLVVGEGFRGGTGYFYFELPVREADDIQRLFAADVTGDGRREVFVRYRQRIEDVQREILLGYTFVGESFERVLDVEVRRAQGDASIGNVVRVVPKGKHWAISISPGRAEDWTRSSYPFVTESTDGHGPLLMPWADRKVVFRFDGHALVR